MAYMAHISPDSDHILLYSIYVCLNKYTLYVDFPGFFIAYRKAKYWPSFFPQKYPQDVDNPVDKFGLYVCLF